MVVDLSELMSLIEQDSIPSWLREQVEDQSTLDALENDGVITLHGPRGEEVEITKLKARSASSNK